MRLLFKNDKANHQSNKEGLQRPEITNELLTSFPHMQSHRGEIQCEVAEGDQGDSIKKHATPPPPKYTAARSANKSEFKALCDQHSKQSTVTITPSKETQ